MWFSSTSFPGSVVLGEIPGRSWEEAKAKFANKSISNIRWSSNSAFVRKFPNKRRCLTTITSAWAAYAVTNLESLTWLQWAIGNPISDNFSYQPTHYQAALSLTFSYLWWLFSCIDAGHRWDTDVKHLSWYLLVLGATRKASSVMKWCTVLDFTMNKLDQTETSTWQFFGKTSKKVSESFCKLLKVCHLKNKVLFKMSRTGILTRRCEYLFRVWSSCYFWWSFFGSGKIFADVFFCIIKSVS